jgi:hypothetical protein
VRAPDVGHVCMTNLGFTHRGGQFVERNGMFSDTLETRQARDNLDAVGAHLVQISADYTTVPTWHSPATGANCLLARLPATWSGRTVHGLKPT